MKLRRIKISGFKSFADKTILEFHDGITAIVGPNGCGKSNIADSFRWVMGEQSAKSMRGGKMMDVIFAGTSKRKPLNLAEVSLTFVNDENLINIPYREVEITRRYHRDGESEYLLNGNSVRLKDIHSLLMDVGVGKNAYAIFEQGKIDQIIQLNPDERRIIFEEASGILKFILNKKEAYRKLEEVDLNVSRLKDIHQEIEKTLQTLEKQAQKTLEFKQEKAELELAEINLYSVKLNNLDKKKSACLDEQKAKCETLEKLKASAHTLKVEIHHRHEAIEKEEGIYKEQERSLYQEKSLRDVRQKESESIQERIQESKKRQTALILEQESLVSLRKERQNQIRESSEKEKKLSEEVVQKAEALAALRGTFKEKEVEISSYRKAHEAMHEDVFAVSKKVHELKTEVRSKEVKEDALSEKIERFSAGALQNKKNLESLVKEEKVKKDALEHAKNEAHQAREAFLGFDKEIKTITEEIDSLEPLFETVVKDLIDLRAREKALKKLKEEREGFSSGSIALLEKFGGKLKNFYEFIDVQSGFEEAVSSVLRPYSETLVASSEADYLEVLNYAKAHKIQDFSLFLLKKGSRKNAESSLLKKVSLNELSRHFLSQKIVLESIENALSCVKENPGSEIFSVDGFFIDSHEVLFSLKGKESSIFLREAELKSLVKKIESASSESQKYKARLDELKEKKKALSLERAEMDKKTRSLEMQLVEKNFAMQKILGDIERLKKDIKILSDNLQEADISRTVLRGELKEQKSQLFREEEILSERLRKKEASQKELENKIKELEIFKAKLQKEEDVFKGYSDESKKYLHALSLLEVKEQESQARIKNIAGELEELKNSVKALQEKEKECKLSLLEIEGGLTESLKALSLFQKKIEEKKKAKKDKDAELDALNQNIGKEEGKENERKMQLVQIETQLESLQTDFQERFKDAVRTSAEGSQDKYERQVKKHKESLASFGDLNMEAISSLEKQREREKELTAEILDLESAKADLEEIVKKLDEESRFLFQDTFEKIKTNFQKNFSILFNGGEADLELTGDSDILKAGIEIVAKPPGKQMRSINLLSGGEKCLTAMALLFSIFEVKSAPFCLLDEIDAPLDDANVGRFTEMVKHFVNRCQFIIITHNKRTMSIADKLFGVSMEERGVSKMLTMEFNPSKEAALV